MILAENSILETHYEVLSVKENASYEEIRMAYRNALLNSHPDKVKDTYDDPDGDLRGKFLKVQNAWEILCDSSSRAIYDGELRTLRLDTEAAENVSLQDMMLEDSGEVLELFYQCRCGDYFAVDSIELNEMGYTLGRKDGEVSLRTPDGSPVSFVLPCGSCSLRIRLLIDANAKLSIEDHSQSS